MKEPAANINDYLSVLPLEQKQALQQLRENIHACIPDLIEIISYQIPTFKHPALGGLIAFGAFKKHLSLFLMSKKAVPQVIEILKGYEIAGTTVHFTPNKPIKKAALKKILMLRLKENEERIAKRKKTKIQS